jgi:hypothetical protein
MAKHSAMHSLKNKTKPLANMARGFIIKRRLFYKIVQKLNFLLKGIYLKISHSRCIRSTLFIRTAHRIIEDLQTLFNVCTCPQGEAIMGCLFGSSSRRI